MLRGLKDDGAVESRRKKLHHAGTLPSVVLADITHRDTDGELIAVPTEWDTEAHGEAPRIRIHVPRKAAPGRNPGVGDRALLRTEETGERDEAIRHTGRVIKVLDRAKQRQLGIFRALPNGGGRLEPVDKKQLGRELSVPPGATADAKDGDLVTVELTRHSGRLGLQTAQVKERLGSLKSERAASFIAIHAHEIPHVFRREALAEAEAARPAASKAAARTGAKSRSSPSIRPTPRTTTTRFSPSPTPTRTTRAASSSRSRSRTSRTT